MKSMKFINNEKGAALIIAIMVMALMSILGMTLLYMSSVNLNIARNEKQGLQAFYAAKAGIEDARKRLINNTADTRGAAGYSMDNNIWVSDLIAANLLLGGGRYEVYITHVSGAAPAYLVEKDSGFPKYRITSTGWDSAGTARRTIEQVVTLTFSNIWKRAITACGALHIDSNSGTDSYSSTAGSYASQTHENDGEIRTSGDVSFDTNGLLKGSIITTGSITFGTNAVMNGNAEAGGQIKLSAVNSTINGSAIAVGSIQNSGKITGTATSGSTIANGGTIGTAPGPVASGSCAGNPCYANAAVAAVLPPSECNAANILTPPADIATNNNNAPAGGITCTGSCSSACTNIAACVTPNQYCCNIDTGVMTLQGGTASAPKKYYFKGLKVGSNSRIQTTGYVEIYVDGDYRQDANSIVRGSSATNPLPAEVLVHNYGVKANSAGGIASTVGIDSNSQLYGRLYAPTASSTNINSNSQVFGAVIAGGMCTACSGGIDSNAGVSFDSALKASASTTASGTVIAEWKECHYGAYGVLAGTPSTEPNTLYPSKACKPN